HSFVVLLRRGARTSQGCRREIAESRITGRMGLSVGCHFPGIREPALAHPRGSDSFPDISAANSVSTALYIEGRRLVILIGLCSYKYRNRCSYRCYTNRG